jgi:hypothetical protein
MKKLMLSVVLTLGLFFGFNSVNTAETKAATVQTAEENYVYVRVQDASGRVWVYVYTQDGIFVNVYEED